MCAQKSNAQNNLFNLKDHLTLLHCEIKLKCPTKSNK